VEDGDQPKMRMGGWGRVYLGGHRAMPAKTDAVLGWQAGVCAVSMGAVWDFVVNRPDSRPMHQES
jgi:hypothetical protein